MATFNEIKADSLENFMIEVNQQFAFILAQLDSKNVKRLNTNETVIKSVDGETQIVGPLIKMYDKQTVPVLRLKEGHDSATSNFVFELYNKSGIKSVGIDSNGDATFTGSISSSAITGGTITIGTGDDVFKADSNGIYLGDSTYSDAPFKVSMAGAATATNLTITGGSISVDSTLTCGNNLIIGSGLSTEKEITLYNSGGNKANISLYSNNQLEIFNWSTMWIGASDITMASDTDITLMTTGAVFITNLDVSGELYHRGGGTFGLFGASPVTQQTATSLAGGATLSDVITKINGILTKLELYGLFAVD